MYLFIVVNEAHKGTCISHQALSIPGEETLSLVSQNGPYFSLLDGGGLENRGTALIFRGPIWQIRAVEGLQLDSLVPD